MAPDQPAIVIDVAVAEPVRRAVGPVAWFVLESLAATALPGMRQLEVSAGTRQIAAIVSLSKDTVARAMRRLADVGLVERVDNRDPLSGRFGSTVYVVDLTAAGLAVEHHDCHHAPASKPPRLKPSSTHPRPLQPVDDRQLTLLD
jgi:DNA-binding transcriptional ArsR family regulator